MFVLECASRGSASSAESSNTSLALQDHRGLCDPRMLWRSRVDPVIDERNQSMNQIRQLITMIPPRIAKNSAVATPNRSCGRSPTAYAKEAIPEGVPGGRLNSVLGEDWSTKSGDEGSSTWSVKPLGTENPSVFSGFQCSSAALAP